MTPEHTDMTGAARLREALELAVECINRHQYWCGYNRDSPGDGIINEALVKAREALAAVPEAPEPVYEWRAVAGYYCHHARSMESMAHKDAARFIEERPADRHRVYVERRTAPGPWERVEEGTER